MLVPCKVSKRHETLEATVLLLAHEVVAVQFRISGRSRFVAKLDICGDNQLGHGADPATESLKNTRSVDYPRPTSVDVLHFLRIWVLDEVQLLGSIASSL